MWFMPSWGRPGRLKQLIDAPGFWPGPFPHKWVTVLVNGDDPTANAYQRECTGIWQMFVVPSPKIPSGETMRCADVHRFITQVWPDLPFYGLLSDDVWPMTPGWFKAMEEAAGDRYISTCAGHPAYPLCRNVECLGGGLVRAMGSLVPAPVKHNFEDNIWDDIARDHNLLRPLPNHSVEHRHWIRGEAERDSTYERGSADFSRDQAIYEQWLISDDKKAMDDRIRKFLCT